MTKPLPIPDRDDCQPDTVRLLPPLHTTDLHWFDVESGDRLKITARVSRSFLQDLGSLGFHARNHELQGAQEETEAQER